ncbi:Nodulation receptor kinase [Ananas comosus]|uniref:non-specific serine/threonine protein kinase n=1 Tax=Ananas comosus TaxID=4615 RepID=A0A199VQP8_ANACO|nr:Nodulation receptor kinase [Ananas comosus]
MRRRNKHLVPKRSQVQCIVGPASSQLVHCAELDPILNVNLSCGSSRRCCRRCGIGRDSGNPHMVLLIPSKEFFEDFRIQLIRAISTSSINLIGFGMFGEVYKGLLQDGMIVAIKRRSSIPSQQFIQEVHHLSSIRHRNLVSLLGYCQENDLQMLVYEYIPNGSVSAHLYGASQVSSGKLEFKHRLSIAHGTAKGLSHLHSLNPPMVHMNFKTANVLVDEDFIPKVADAGLRSLLDRVDGAGPSSRTATDDPFLDPEAKDSGIFSKESDVYSFGVFLLELVSGREVRLDRSIIEWILSNSSTRNTIISIIAASQAQNYQESSTFSAFVDQRMGSSFTSEGMREFLRLITWCVNPLSERRPPMNYVEMEIDRIREKEMSLTTIMGEGTTTVTLGSQLFTTSK